MVSHARGCTASKGMNVRQDRTTATNASRPLARNCPRSGADPPVEDAWWRWDGKAAQYILKRKGTRIGDTWQVGIDGGAPAMLEGSARADLDAASALLDTSGSRSAFVRNGDVFVRDLRSGALTQLTRSNEAESRLLWSGDGALAWRGADAWYRWDGRATVQAAQAKAEDAPGTPPKPDDLRDRQLRLIETLKNDRALREAAREQGEAWRKADPTRAAAPVYLGAGVDIVDSALSPDGRWLLVATTSPGARPRSRNACATPWCRA